MNRLLALILLVFAGVMAFVIGERMSIEAMAVVIGVVFGVAASIPTSLLIASLMRRATSAAAPPPRYDNAPVQAQPPMIIVNPAMPPGHLYPGEHAWSSNGLHSPIEATPLMPLPRRFRIVGADGSEED